MFVADETNYDWDEDKSERTWADRGFGFEIIYDFLRDYVLCVEIQPHEREEREKWIGPKTVNASIFFARRTPDLPALSPVKTLLLVALFGLCAISAVSARVQAEPFISAECEPLLEAPSVSADIPYAKGLLWKISKAGKDSYLFGTMHVPDSEVTTLPAPVDRALRESEQFVMEALPDPQHILQLQGMMFFADGDLLSDHVDAPIFARATEILSAYQLPPQAVAMLKPWAAFLTMSSSPPGPGEVQDLVLLSAANENGAEVAGLETLMEQASLFDRLTLAEQVKLLTDTVCHYDLTEESFAALKSLYLKQDLGGMYRYSWRYTFKKGEVFYEQLTQALIADRNITMVERMQPMLARGKAFIAIGALHLTGAEGVLALLEKQGYRLQRIFQAMNS